MIQPWITTPVCKSAKNLTTAITNARQNVLFWGTRLLINKESIKKELTETAWIDIALDGSHDQDKGTIMYGWIMAINQIAVAEGKGPVEGHPLLVGSFRAEAYGLALAAAFLQLMIRHLLVTIDKHKWLFHLDNKALIKQMDSYNNETVTAKWENEPDADITNLAKKQLQGIPAQILFVKSHQDKSQPKLSLPAALNIQADSLATQQQQQMKHPMLTVTVPHKRVIIKNMEITKDSQRWLLEAASTIPLQQYYRDKYNWDSRAFEDINWDLQHKVLIGYELNDQQRILKFVHSWLPTNK
jgi:hypothetical protein